MRRYQEQLVFSASDLVTFLGCRHATVLDRRQLDAPVPLAKDDDYLQLLQEKGLQHELAYRERVRAEGRQVVEVPNEGPLERRTERTREAMFAGADVIYQGAFLSGRWHGYADFLLKTPGESALGPYHYEPLDTKLAHGAKPKHVIQLGVYADLIAGVQEKAPERLHVLLGTGESVALPARSFQYYLTEARRRFEAFVGELPQQSVGEPCKACEQCRWRERCEGEWEGADHLSLVARITGGQIEKLNAASITTVAQLGALTPGFRIPGVQAATLERLHGQAQLQSLKRRDGKNRWNVLPAEAGRGFARLPQPSTGDLFFDMEGDPLIDGGLEYLFGFAYDANGQPAFQPFFGHTRAEEKVAFEAAMDFISARRAQFPVAHVYHYGTYEESALKRLAMQHGTREAEVDSLLRDRKLVDLYRVVREGLRVSESSYSIKNLEVFYMPPREDAVRSAGDSIVVYERWRNLREDRLLQEIEDYNKADCISTLKLRDWLLTLRPAELTWYTGPASDPREEQRSAARQDAQQQTSNTLGRLMQGPENQHAFRELVGQLLEFHRREAKPEWWFQFTSAEFSLEELIDDGECIGGLQRDTTQPPFPEKRSTVHTFVFPPQDFKMRMGDKPRRAGTAREPAGEIMALDEKVRQIQLKLGPKASPFGDSLSLIPEPPLDNEVLQKAVYRYAEAVIAGDGRYNAVTSALKGEFPRIRGWAPGAPVVPPGTETVAAAIKALENLDRTHLLVQGPPGAGKTFLSANAIVALLKSGRRVGVAAHSHKAINHLLEEVAALAQKQNVGIRGVKKCSGEEHECRAPGITNVRENNEVTTAHNLVAGTAWLFSRPEHDQAFDYLFIDEAGQVSLGNLVAMGVAARNIVLVGDQMQLSQPIQGSHPGQSGQSALEFLLKDYATVPPERGVFLDITRRMHPDVCQFISEAVYDGRLRSHPSCVARRLVLSDDVDPALKATGLSWVPVTHQDCTQKSAEEGERVRELVDSLIQQRWIEEEGRQRSMTLQDILIVSPYNMQVNLLQGLLQPGARVGTVDKFQGQEAAVVIVSMTASSAEDIPRGMEFLYSRNRLNVAVSRAKTLAIIVASPLLLEAPCARVEQMQLVNTLCFAHAYAARR
jgi:predicted RecB family nuclease